MTGSPDFPPRQGGAAVLLVQDEGSVALNKMNVKPFAVKLEKKRQF